MRFAIIRLFEWHVGEVEVWEYIIGNGSLPIIGKCCTTVKLFINHYIHQDNQRLVGQFVCLLVGWLVPWFVGWLVGCSLVGKMVRWPHAVFWLLVNNVSPLFCLLIMDKTIGIYWGIYLLNWKSIRILLISLQCDLWLTTIWQDDIPTRRPSSRWCPLHRQLSITLINAFNHSHRQLSITLIAKLKWPEVERQGKMLSVRCVKWI